MTTSIKITLALAGIIIGAFFLGGASPYLVFNPSAGAWGIATVALCAGVACFIVFRSLLAKFADGDAENVELHVAISSWEIHAQRLEAQIAARRHPADVLPSDVEALRAALGSDIEAIGHAAAGALGRIREFHGLIAALGSGAAQVTAERDALRDELAIVDEAHTRRKGGRMVAMIEDEMATYAKRLQPGRQNGAHPRVLDAPPDGHGVAVDAPPIEPPR